MEPHRFRSGLTALVALALLAVFSLNFLSPPSPVGADAPADQFSAERAFVHVERIGAHQHVTGGDGASDVREYIVTTLTALGLQTRVQDAVGEDDVPGGFAMARVRNVVAVLPGQSSTGRVFLVAHYDSVQVSYGGNDDGAGVASLLETARAMAAGAKPRNDIVFVFTDAEEACLCGAEAFVSQDPLAQGGGVALNLESRGSSGPAIMFETSGHNAGVVGVYGGSVPDPVATSFAVEVYRILPNDTDFTVFRTSGRFTGLNSAYIDGSAVYHSPEDRPSYLDKASLQHLGGNALALTRAFAAADLITLARPSAGDSTYFPVLGQLVRYPGLLVWIFAGLGLLGVLALAVLARRRGVSSVGRSAAGLGLATIPLLLAPAAAQLLWLLLVSIRPGYSDLIDPWRPGWFRLSVVALVATVLLTWYGLLRMRIGAWPLAIGGLGWLAVLGLVLAAATPGGSYLAALPAIAGSVAAILTLSRPGPAGLQDLPVQPASDAANAEGGLFGRRPWLRLVPLGVGAAVAVLILAPTVQLFFPALGLRTGAAPALFAVMLGLALLPVLEWLYPGEEARRRLRVAAPGLIAGVLAVACVGVGLVVDRFDAAHPVPTQLMYALDHDTGKAIWAGQGDPDQAWTRDYVSGSTDVSGQFPVLTTPVATGPAQAADLPAPTVTVVSDLTAGGKRNLTVNLRPQRAVRLVYLQVKSDTRVLSAVVDGRDVPADAITTRFGILFHAPPPDGLVITLGLAAPGPVDLRVMDGSDGLTALPGFIPRPDGVGIAGSHTSELVLVARTYTV